MTKPPPKHTVDLKKHRREPLDPRWEPVCVVCGSLCDPTDIDTAKSQRSRHESSDHSGARVL